MTDRPARNKRQASPATVSALWRLATAGKSRAEAAQELGLSYHHVTVAARMHKIPFHHGQQVEKPKRPRPKHPIGRVKAAGLVEELTLAQRIDFLTLVRKGRYAPSEAFKTLRRPDLAAKAAELETLT